MAADINFLTNTQIVLSVFVKFAKFEKKREWMTAHELARWVPLSRSTVYRLLPKMAKLGLLETQRKKTAVKTTTRYKISEKGRELCEAQGRMF